MNVMKRNENAAATSGMVARDGVAEDSLSAAGEGAVTRSGVAARQPDSTASDAGWNRASIKVPGGKLVTAAVRLSDDGRRIAGARFSGDFFVDESPLEMDAALRDDETGHEDADLIAAMGLAVVGMSVDASLEALARTIGYANGGDWLVEGAMPADFARAVIKAMGGRPPRSFGSGTYGPSAQDDMEGGGAARSAQDDGGVTDASAQDGMPPQSAAPTAPPEGGAGAPAMPARASTATQSSPAWPDEQWEKLPLQVVVPGAIAAAAGRSFGSALARSAQDDSSVVGVAPAQNDGEDGVVSSAQDGGAPTASVAAPGNDGAYDPAMQMALDEVIAREVAAGSLGPMLRFWEWSAPAVVIGAYQSLHDEVDLAAARARGMTVVRRMTGGGAMFIEPGNTITYSLYVPGHFSAGLTVEESYRRCDAWLFAALARLGVDARPGGMNDIVSSAGKIAGAAQRRFASPALSCGLRASGAILHHVTMAYDIDAQAMVRVLRINKEKTADKAVKSSVKRVDPLRSQTGMPRAAIIEGLAGTVLERLPHARAAALPADIIEQARALAQSKYADPSWTARIP